MLRVILRHPVGRVSLHLRTTTVIAKYRDHRLALVKSDTVRRELAIIRHCIEVARNEWGFVLPQNPVQQVKMPRAGNPRQRRAHPGELEKLLKACEASRCPWLPAVILCAQRQTATSVMAAAISTSTRMRIDRRKLGNLKKSRRGPRPRQPAPPPAHQQVEQSCQSIC